MISRSPSNGVTIRSGRKPARRSKTKLLVGQGGRTAWPGGSSPASSARPRGTRSRGTASAPATGARGAAILLHVARLLAGPEAKAGAIRVPALKAIGDLHRGPQGAGLRHVAWSPIGQRRATRFVRVRAMGPDRAARRSTGRGPRCRREPDAGSWRAIATPAGHCS